MQIQPDLVTLYLHVQTFLHERIRISLDFDFSVTLWGKKVKVNKKVNQFAMSGNRTRVNCLEGSYANHYTNIACC